MTPGMGMCGLREELHVLFGIVAFSELIGMLRDMGGIQIEEIDLASISHYGDLGYDRNDSTSQLMHFRLLSSVLTCDICDVMPWQVPLFF